MSIKNAGATPTQATFLGCLRHWLECNKVFFETTAAIFLALMAIIVSVVQIVQTSKQNYLANQLTQNSNELAAAQNALIAKQNKLVELQTKIALQQVVPQFVIVAKQLDEDGIGKATEDKVFVRNLGGVVRELVAKSAVFLDVELTPMDPRKGERIEQRIPVNGYYSAIAYNPEGKGQLLTILGNRNNQSQSKLVREFAEKSESEGFYGFIDVKRFIKLSYRTLLGEKHTKYFYVPLIYGAHELSSEEGESVFKVFHQGFETKEMLEFEKLSATALFGHITK